MDLLLPSSDLLGRLIGPQQSVTDLGSHSGLVGVTPAQLDEALAALAAGHVEYVILQDGDAFLQAAGDGDGPYQLEHSRGDPEGQEVVAEPVDRAALAAALHAFLAGDPAWRTAHPWAAAGVGRPARSGGGFLRRRGRR